MVAQKKYKIIFSIVGKNLKQRNLSLSLNVRPETDPSEKVLYFLFGWIMRTVIDILCVNKLNSIILFFIFFTILVRRHLQSDEWVILSYSIWTINECVAAGVSGAVDAVQSQGVLRAVWIPVLVYTDLLAGHASTLTTAGRACRTVV